MAVTLSHPESDPITAGLRAILRAILGELGMWQLSNPQKVLAWGRINAAFRGIERMLARFRAGRLRQVTSRGVTQKPREARQKPPTILPRKFGWLVAAGKHQAACYGGQLKHLLNEPEMQALLAASPQAKRILRPLCRALAIELPWTVTAPRPPRLRKPRKPRPKPEPFKIPLPRGVITWARREKALENARKRRG